MIVPEVIFSCGRVYASISLGKEGMKCAIEKN